jgi:PPP family 3-phenylpropionic acid transporter
MADALPYWRLSSFYFFFFAIIGALAPYWSPYLRSLGFSAAAIGELSAIVYLSRIVAPSLGGWLADRSGRPMSVVRWTCLAALLGFAGVFLGHGYWWLALVMTVFSFFWNASLPQFEANTLNHLGEQEHRYSRLRVWGSIGFIVVVGALGALVDRFGEGVVPWAMLVLFAGMWLSSLTVPEKAAPRGHQEHPQSFWTVLKRPAVQGFLLACVLSQAAHGPYYAFFSIYLQDRGFRLDVIGVLWAWAVVAEIGVFLLMHRWLPTYGPRVLMAVALALGGLRWLLIGRFPDSFALLFAAQTLHAASFGVYHAVGIALINRLFTGRSQSRGQAVYSMTFGGGVALGSLISGYLWEPLGGSGVFYLAALASGLAAVVAYAALPLKLAAAARSRGA